MYGEYIMELIDCDEISSIALESMTHSIDRSELYIISNDLSSLTYISSSDSSNLHLTTEHSNSDVIKLKAQLRENVQILHHEIKLYEEANKEEGNSRKVTLSDELVDQLNGIKTKIEDLKLKLKGSENLIDEKFQENCRLKDELKTLEEKAFTSNDKVCVCNCTLF